MKKEDKKKMLLMGMTTIGICGLGYMLRKYHIEINDLKGDIDILRYHLEQDAVAIQQLRDDLDIDNRTLTALYKQIEAIKKVIKWEVEEN